MCGVSEVGGGRFRGKVHQGAAGALVVGGESCVGWQGRQKTRQLDCRGKLELQLEVTWAQLKLGLANLAIYVELMMAGRVTLWSIAVSGAALLEPGLDCRDRVLALSRATDCFARGLITWQKLKLPRQASQSFSTRVLSLLDLATTQNLPINNHNKVIMPYAEGPRWSAPAPAMYTSSPRQLTTRSGRTSPASPPVKEHSRTKAMTFRPRKKFFLISARFCIVYCPSSGSRQLLTSF